MSEDKKEKDEKKSEKKPPVMKMARTSSGDNSKDQASIYDTTQIKTLAFTQNNPVAQAVADMLGKTEDPEIRNTIKRAATDVMKPQLGSPEELSKKLASEKESEAKESEEKAQ